MYDVNTAKAKLREWNLRHLQDNQLRLEEADSLRQEFLEAGFRELRSDCDFLVAMLYLKQQDWQKFDSLYTQMTLEKTPDVHNAIYLVVLKGLRYFFEQSDLERSIKHLLRAKSMLSEVRPTCDGATFIGFHIYYLLGMLYYFKGDYVCAFKYSKRAVRQKLDKADRFLKVKPYKWLGMIENATGNPLGAIRYFESCEKLYLKYGVSFDYADVLNSWGLIYYHYGQLEMAKNLFKISLELAEKYYYYNIKGDALNNLGISYFKLSDYQNAIDCYKRSLECRMIISRPECTVYTYSNLGQVYLAMHQLDTALEYLQNALEKAEKFKLKVAFRVSLHCDITEVYLERDDTKTAFEHLKKADKLNKKNKDKVLTLRLYLLHSKYYKQIKYYKKALDFTELAQKIKNEILQEDKEMMLKLRMR